MAFDDLIEGLGRRLAARTTRRTLLGRAAQVGVLVAGGPALATLLVERAEARVCGQSGVSPKCPTFDCGYDNSVWGWCWYASGNACCAGGGLKKICDCCTDGWPNVHGYCPSGHNVRCIVESCAADPRVMYVPIHRAPGMTGPSVAAAKARLDPPRTGGAVVVGDGEDPMLAGVAAAVAGNLGLGFVLSGRGRLSASVLAELQRRGSTKAIVFDSLPASFDEELAGYGVEVERIGQGFIPEVRSLTAARWLVAQTGATESVTITSPGAAPAAAAFAGAHRLPLVISTPSAKELGLPTWVLETDVVPADVPGARPVPGRNQEELALALATLTAEHYKRTDLTVHLVPAGAPDVSIGLAGAGGVLLYHPAGVLGPAAYGWIHAHRPSVGRAVLGGSFGSLGDPGLYDLQSALHGFDTHRLQGVSGQGLPVISQPRAEREIGRARVAGATPSAEPSYWSSRADLARRN
jgi:hypothetical protein